MNRLTMGAVLGGLAAYLYDPESGAERRERLLSLWRQNRGSLVQARRAATEAVESARPLARRMTNAIGRDDWAQGFEPRRRAASLPTLIGAAALGGILVYFLDPVKGSERRQRLRTASGERWHSAMEATRQVARQTSEAVKPVAERVGDQMADAIDGVKFKVASTVNTEGETK